METFYELGCGSYILSIDRIKPVQDTQRQRLDGRSSFDKRIEFLDKAQAMGVSVSIR
jgi:sulfatase maturation enzyme AslB (radical SAM superfamily)